MKNQTNKKRALTAVLIVAVVLTVLWLGVFVASIFVQGGDFGGYFGNLFQGIGQLYAYPFLGETGDTAKTILSISCLVVAGVFAYLIIFGIVFVCIKKKPSFIGYVVMLLVALFIADYSFVYGQNMVESLMKLFQGDLPSAVDALLGVIFGVVLLILGALALIMIIVTYIMGLVYAGRRQEVKVEEKEEAIAESAEDPEVVQEADENAVVAPVEPIVLESEPEPEPEPEVEAAPVVEEEPAEEVVEEPVVEEEPAPEPAPAPAPVSEEAQHVEINVNNAPAPAPQPAPAIDQASLASLLREVVRDIVRDEIARNNANQPQPVKQADGSVQTITGATFGGPLVVQYFNGGINGVTQPAPAPQVVEQKVEPAPAPAPAPVEEPKKEEPAPVEEPKEEPKPEPAPEPVVEEKPRPLFQKKEEAPAAPVVVAAPAPEAPKYERLTFAERLLKSESDIHDLYNEIKNEILSYGVKSRISANGDTFRLHKKMYVRITVAGKSLKLYFALDPKDYANSTIPVQDASNKDMYQDIPLVFKVKSGLSVRRCKELIQDAMEKDGLEQGEVAKVNWIKEMKAEMKAAKKKEAEEKK